MRSVAPWHAPSRAHLRHLRPSAPSAPSGLCDCGREQNADRCGARAYTEPVFRIAISTSTRVRMQSTCMCCVASALDETETGDRSAQDAQLRWFRALHRVPKERQGCRQGQGGRRESEWGGWGGWGGAPPKVTCSPPTAEGMRRETKVILDDKGIMTEEIW